MPNDCTEIKTTTIGGVRILLEKLEFKKARAYGDSDTRMVKKIDHFLNMEACSYNFSLMIDFLEDHPEPSEHEN